MDDVEATPTEPTVNVSDPFGKIGSLPQSQAKEAFDNGYKPATPDEIQMQKNEDRFGGVEGEVFSGALGAARTATLGGSDLLLTHLPGGVGFSPEQIKGFSETNPGSTMLGEVGGLIADPFGLGNVISQAGKAVGGGAKAALEAAGVATDSSRVAKVLSAGLHYGTEGALYGGIANTLNEQALGDPSLNGEKVLSNIGFGALIGGLSGGAFKLAGEGITPALRKLGDGLSSIKKELIGSGFGEDSLITKVLPKKFSEAIADRQLNLDTQGQASTLRKISTGLNSVLDNLNEETSGFSADIDKKAVGSLFKTSAKVAGEAQQAISESLSGVIDQIKSVIPDGKTNALLESLKEKSKTDVFNGSSAQAIFNSLKKLRGAINDFAEKNASLGDSLTPISDSIHETMKDPNIFGPSGAGIAMHEEAMEKFSKLVAPEGKAKTEFQKIFGESDNGKWKFDIKKMHDAFSDPDIQSRTKNMNMLNDFYTQLKEMPDNLLNARRTIPNSSWKPTTLKSIIENSEKTNEQAFKDYIEGINKRRPVYGWKDLAPLVIAKWHPVVAAAIEAYDIYQDPVHATHELALIERYLGQSSKKSLDAIDAIFNPSVITKGKVQEKIDAGDKGSSNNDDNHDKLKRVANSPEEFAENLEKNSKELSRVAPKLSQSLQVSASNAIGFLSSKLPQGDDHLNPLSKPLKPSASDMAKFGRYKEIVDNPLLALKQVRLGTITPETVETMANVYPSFYEHLKQAVVEKAFSQKAKGHPISFQTKQAISTFIGQPLDGALYPQAVLANQAIFAAIPKPGDQPQGGQKVRAKGLDNLSGAERSQNKYSALSDI